MKFSVVVLLIAWCASASAQPRARSALDSLGDAAAAAATRYADRSVAASDGYHRIGPDFPGMGEHWLHPSVLLSGRVNAEQPTLLMYATILGRPMLTGVGFVTTTDAAHPTRDLPGWPSAWHEHSGLLSDESGVAPGSTTSGDTHVWVLHVWTTLQNSDGRFMPDNWALPFVRAGIIAPAAANADAARAAALASGGDHYIRDVLTDANIRTSANAARVDSVLSRETTIAVRVVQVLRIAPEAGDVGRASLARQWRSLLEQLATVTGRDVEPLLARTHEHPH